MKGGGGNANLKYFEIFILPKSEWSGFKKKTNKKKQNNTNKKKQRQPMLQRMQRTRNPGVMVVGVLIGARVTEPGVSVPQGK